MVMTARELLKEYLEALAQPRGGHWRENFFVSPIAGDKYRRPSTWVPGTLGPIGRLARRILDH